MDPKKVLMFTKALVYCVAVVTVSLLSVTVVVWAMGYQYNPDTGGLEQTAVIALTGSAPDAQVYLNGVLTDRTLPTTFRYLKESRYEILIKKTGYNDWSEVINLSPGQAKTVSNLNLVAVGPKVSPYTSLNNFGNFQKFDSGIELNGDELYDNGTMVSRFFVIPSQVHRYRDGYLYQIKDEIRLSYPSYNQDNLVYKLASNEVAPIYIPLFPDNLYIQTSTTSALQVDPFTASE